MSVQNMHLMTTSLEQVGGYWSSFNWCRSARDSHGRFVVSWNTRKKSNQHLITFFLTYFMPELKKYARNWNLMMTFWAGSKIGQPIWPIRKFFFALVWSALKKPSRDNNFWVGRKAFFSFFLHARIQKSRKAFFWENLFFILR